MFSFPRARPASRKVHLVDKRIFTHSFDSQHDKITVKELIAEICEQEGIYPMHSAHFGISLDEFGKKYIPYTEEINNDAFKKENLYFRFQFKASDCTALKLRTDDRADRKSKAFDYYLRQCRHYFVNGVFKKNLSKLGDDHNKKQEMLLRMVILEMLLVSKDEANTVQKDKKSHLQHVFNKSTGRLESILAQYVDKKEEVKKCKRIIERSLQTFEKVNEPEFDFLREIELLPDYQKETFEVFKVYGSRDNVTSRENIWVRVHPKNGVSRLRIIDSKFKKEDNNFQFDNIDSLTIKETEDNAIAPKYHLIIGIHNTLPEKFFSDSRSVLQCLCSWIDGYHRLLVDQYVSLYANGKDHVSGNRGIHGPIEHSISEKFLESCESTEGDFLIRQHRMTHGDFVLTIQAERGFKHYEIYKLKSTNDDEPKYSIDRKTRFSTIDQLVEFYGENKISKMPLLKRNIKPNGPMPFLSDRKALSFMKRPEPSPIRGGVSWIDSKSLIKITRLPEGRFGAVYLCKQRYDNSTQDVAVREFTNEVINKEAFNRIAVYYQKMQSHLIVRLTGSSSPEDPIKLLAFEYMKLGPLDEHLHKNKDSMKYRSILKYMIDITEGMLYLEKSMKVVHGNLRLHNVLVTDGDNIKLSDACFDWVRQQEKQLLMAEIVSSGYWRAPEVVNGEKMLSFSSDVWSFGVLLWDIVSLSKQLDENLRKEMLRHMLTEDSQRQPSIMFYCPDFVKELMFDCWCKEPEQRPSFERIYNLLRQYKKTVSTYLLDRPYFHWQSIEKQEIEEIRLQRSRLAERISNEFSSSDTSTDYHLVANSSRTTTDSSAWPNSSTSSSFSSSSSSYLVDRSKLASSVLQDTSDVTTSHGDVEMDDVSPSKETDACANNTPLIDAHALVRPASAVHVQTVNDEPMETEFNQMSSTHASAMQPLSNLTELVEDINSSMESPMTASPSVKSMATLPPNDLAPKEMTLKYMAFTDMTSKYVSMKDTAPKMVGPKDMAPKFMTLKDIAPKPVSSKVVAQKAVAPKSIAPKAVTPKAIAPKIVASKAVAPKVVAAKAVSYRRSSSKDQPPDPEDVESDVMEVANVLASMANPHGSSAADQKRRNLHEINAKRQVRTRTDRQMPQLHKAFVRQKPYTDQQQYPRRSIAMSLDHHQPMYSPASDSAYESGGSGSSSFVAASRVALPPGFGAKPSIFSTAANQEASGAVATTATMTKFMNEILRPVDGKKRSHSLSEEASKMHKSAAKRALNGPNPFNIGPVVPRNFLMKKKELTAHSQLKGQQPQQLQPQPVDASKYLHDLMVQKQSQRSGFVQQSQDECPTTPTTSSVKQQYDDQTYKSMAEMQQLGEKMSHLKAASPQQNSVPVTTSTVLQQVPTDPNAMQVAINSYLTQLVSQGHSVVAGRPYFIPPIALNASFNQQQSAAVAASVPQFMQLLQTQQQKQQQFVTSQQQAAGVTTAQATIVTPPLPNQPMDSSLQISPAYLPTLLALMASKNIFASSAGAVGNPNHLAAQSVVSGSESGASTTPLLTAPSAVMAGSGHLKTKQQQQHEQVSKKPVDIKPKIITKSVDVNMEYIRHSSQHALNSANNVSHSHPQHQRDKPKLLQVPQASPSIPQNSLRSLFDNKKDQPSRHPLPAAPSQSAPAAMIQQATVVVDKNSKQQQNNARTVLFKAAQGPQPMRLILPKGNGLSSEQSDQKDLKVPANRTMQQQRSFDSVPSVSSSIASVSGCSSSVVKGVVVHSIDEEDDVGGDDNMRSNIITTATERSVSTRIKAEPTSPSSSASPYTRGGHQESLQYRTLSPRGVKDGSSHLKQRRISSDDMHGSSEKLSKVQKRRQSEDNLTIISHLGNVNVFSNDDLHFEKELGEGQFGKVWKALLRCKGEAGNISLRPVAVKKLKSMEEQSCKEFKNEVKHLASLNHECIVKLIGVSVDLQGDDEGLCIITDLMELGNLNQFIVNQRQTITEEMLIRFALQIAEGMNYLQMKTIVHRDLAARNVLVESRDRVKVSDFGLSRMFSDDKDYYRGKTASLLPIRWYALESIRDSVFTSKSDVWSYGVTLWEVFLLWGSALTYVSPYKGMNGTEILDFIENGKRLTKPEKCKDELWTLILSCWHKNPDDRPSFYSITYDILNNAELNNGLSNT
eukprot:gene20492-22508_t